MFARGMVDQAGDEERLALHSHLSASLYCCCIRDKRDCVGRKRASPEGRAQMGVSAAHPEIARRIERQSRLDDPRDQFQPRDDVGIECAIAPQGDAERLARRGRSEEHTSELQSLMRISYADFCLTHKQHTYKT